MAHYFFLLRAKKKYASLPLCATSTRRTVTLILWPKVPFIKAECGPNQINTCPTHFLHVTGSLKTKILFLSLILSFFLSLPLCPSLTVETIDFFRSYHVICSVSETAATFYTNWEPGLVLACWFNDHLILWHINVLHGANRFSSSSYLLSIFLFSSPYNKSKWFLSAQMLS